MDESPPIDVSAGGRILRFTEIAARAMNARLCFGEPVSEGGRTVIPVAIVSGGVGLGFGSSGGDSPGDGGGLGGGMGGRPAGFIEVSAEQARFRRIVTATDVVQLTIAAAILARVLLRLCRSIRRS